MTTDAEATRPLRADAERNRLRIIAAARELFAQRGLDVSLDEVAEAADVGVGTVYRRFANRDELIAGVLIEHLNTVNAKTAAALENDDPWAAVVDLVTWLAQSMAEDRGLAAIIMRVDHSHPDITAVKTQMSERVEQMFTRARDAGVVRPDLASTDFYAIFTMLSAVADATQETAPGVWRRYLGLILDAIKADPQRNTLDVPPMTFEQVIAMQRAKHDAKRRASEQGG
ncbi:TetR/AcrR family transcriptional regulator [Gordonia sp. NPDC003950]